MAWTFVEQVDTGQSSPVNGRDVYWVRATFSDGTNTICRTVYFYDNPPTLQQRVAARNRILDELNAEPEEQNIIDEYLDELRIYYVMARRAGKTKLQILLALRQTFRDLIEN